MKRVVTGDPLIINYIPMIVNNYLIGYLVVYRLTDRVVYIFMERLC